MIETLQAANSEATKKIAIVMDGINVALAELDAIDRAIGAGELPGDCCADCQATIMIARDSVRVALDALRRVGQ